ncbi:MAG TPA: glycosyltransferase family 9 protein [Patescibacteria group bacterium]
MVDAPEGTRNISTHELVIPSGRNALNYLSIYANNGGPFFPSEKDLKVRSLLKEKLQNADSVVIQLGGALGDTVIQSAYMNGVLASLDSVHRSNVPVTLLIDDDKKALFEGYVSDRIKVVGTTLRKSPEDQLQEVAKYTSHASLYVDLSSRSSILGNNFDIAKERAFMTDGKISGKDITCVGNLYMPGQTGYARLGIDRRYGDFVKEIFGVDKLIFPSERARVFLPKSPDYEKIKKGWESQLNTDSQTMQIAVIVESAFSDKQYGASNWAEAIKQLAATVGYEKPDQKVAVNVIFNGKSQSKGFEKASLHHAFFDVLRDTGVVGRINYVSDSVKNLSVLLNTQNVVLSNDTGLAHIAAATPDGPPVVVLYKESRFPSTYWRSSNKQVAIPSSHYWAGDPYDSSNKEINKIDPLKVAEIAWERMKLHQKAA